MKVIFDKKTGEILDLVASIQSIINYEKLAEENIKNSEDGKVSSYLKTASSIKLQGVLDSGAIDCEQAKLYFPKDETFFDLISPRSIYESSEREDFLEYIKSISAMKEEEILLKVYRFLIKRVPEPESSKQDDSEPETSPSEATNTKVAKKEDKSPKNLHKLLKVAQLSLETKWMLSCLINEPLEFLRDFCNILMEYNKKYPILFKKEKNELLKFTKEQDTLIEEDGEKYVVGILEHFLKKDYVSSFNEVVVSTSFITDLYINIEEETNRALLIIGVNYKKVLKNMKKNNSEEKHILVLKNMADETRYKILKLLSKKDYYGLELSKILNITTPSVSYHMNYLLLAGLVSVTKKEQKVYYSLNREGLKDTFEFLYKEFKL